MEIKQHVDQISLEGLELKRGERFLLKKKKREGIWAR